MVATQATTITPDTLVDTGPGIVELVNDLVG